MFLVNASCYNFVAQCCKVHVQLINNCIHKREQLHNYTLIYINKFLGACLLIANQINAEADKVAVIDNESCIIYNIFVPRDIFLLRRANNFVD